MIARFAGAALLCAICQSHSAPSQLVIHSTPVAGVAYHNAANVWSQLNEGDALDLVREHGNPHDARAVRVVWRDHTLGYLPAAENAPVAAALDRGRRVTARIHSVRNHPNPRERLRIDLLITLPGD